jgi:hypothetical protein
MSSSGDRDHERKEETAMAARRVYRKPRLKKLGLLRRLTRLTF